MFIFYLVTNKWHLSEAKKVTFQGAMFSLTKKDGPSLIDGVWFHPNKVSLYHNIEYLNDKYRY